MKKVCKIRIYPNNSQIKLINETLGCCRYVKNLYIEYNQKIYNEEGRFISGYDFSKIINKLKKTSNTYSWIYKYSSKAIKDAIPNIKSWIEENAGLALAVGVLLCLSGAQAIPYGINLLITGAKGLWSGGKDLDSSALSNKITSELDKVNTAAKKGVKTINDTISGINVPNGFSLDSSKFTIPKNGYARGTVVPPNKPHLAWFGDNTQEPEVVSPVSTMKTAFKEAMTELGGSSRGGTTVVVLEIDGREFGRAVVEQGNKENRRIGTRLVIV